MNSAKQRERDFIIQLALMKKLGPVAKYKIWQLAHQLQTFNYEELFTKTQLSTSIQEKIRQQVHSMQLDIEVEMNSCYPQMTIIDDDYPPLLKEIAAPPLVLYYYGSPEIMKKKSLAVVGSRKMTEYGKVAIDQLVPEVVNAGVTVVSGLARGVDSTAQRVALECGGNVVGVIGCGLPQAYPKENEALQKEIMVHGVVISEYPFGTPPLPHHFPERNRIIAGLSHTCLVIESTKKSGTLITANIALRENRNVCAVPGRIDSLFSVGCNELIEVGARPILQADDLLEELGV